ncbi:TSUP family transporter [Bacillus subtilis]|nr:TSUP family transporter [Bacillus subtilis]
MASIPSPVVAIKINEWYKHIKRFNVKEAQMLREEVRKDIDVMEEDEQAVLYFQLMEFRHQLMTDYVQPSKEPLEKSDYLKAVEGQGKKMSAILEYYGAYSHYREGNIQLKSGLIVGALACVASFAGAKIAPFIPEGNLHYLTAGMLFLSAVFMMIKLFVLKEETEQQPLSSRQLLVRGIILGLVSGLLSGMFGIGSAPFIQVGLLILLRLSIRQAVGTTMLVIIPISIGGGIGYITAIHQT